MTEVPLPAATGTFPLPDQLEMFRRMLLIRCFEERVAHLYADGEVPGFVHLSVGQEAVAVGSCWPLRAEDGITSTHRGHGHCLAKGMSPVAMFAELMGRASGSNRGRGGSMHIADPELGVFGANGIVAAGLPVAVGVATASRLRATDAVTVAFFGDGAIAQGAFHEAVNLAVVWSLPIIFLCENNGFAEFTPTTSGATSPSLRQRTAGYGLNYREVDGSDVAAVSTMMSEAVDAVRRGEGPRLIEAHTYRWRGHYEGDPELYRDPDDAEMARHANDPILRHREHLLRLGAKSAVLAELEQSVAEEIDRAVDVARASALPEPSDIDAFVYRVNHRVPIVAHDWHPTNGDATFRYMDAVHDALAFALAEDADVFLAGIDVGASGNVFGLTRGLASEFPGRLLDTPISESAIMGLAVGSAMAGMKPIVEIMYLDFITVCFDQLVNQAAKLQFMTGGKAKMSLVVRTQYGTGRSSGSQHSQSLEALLAHIPGLKVVMPATPADAYGLLRSAIIDADPVVVIENRLLYGSRGPKPPADYYVPIGKARIARAGSDITVVAWSGMVPEAIAASESLAAAGISAEVVDLRTVSPIDFDTILASVEKTGRLIVTQQAVNEHGLGAEIAARIAVDGYWVLDAPIIRVGGRFTPVPYSPPLETAWLPGRATIVEAALNLVRF